MAQKKKRERAIKGEGHIRQRKDGRWEYIYTDKNGEPKSVYGKTELEVYEKKRAIQSALHEGTYVDPSAYTVSTWADYFFEELYLQQNVDTRASVHSHIKIHIKPFFKTMKLQDVDSEDVIRFHRALIEKGLAVHTIQNIQATLVQVFQSAIPKRIKINPAAGIKIEKGAKPEMLYFKTDEYLEFCEALHNREICSYVDAMLFTIALNTGMREGELMGLDFEHIDFESGTIYIHQQLKKLKSFSGQKKLPNKKYYIRTIDKEYYLAPPKHGKKRHIKPGVTTMGLFREIRSAQIAQRLHTGLGEQYNPNGFVFVNGIGKHLASETLRHHFHDVLAAMGANEKMRIHDLRHTYVYNALQSGLTYDQISENLGHKSVDFTKRQYGHFPEFLHEDSATKMDAFHEKMKQQQEAKKQKKGQAT